MTDEYVESRINFINNKSERKNAPSKTIIESFL